MLKAVTRDVSLLPGGGCLATSHEEEEEEDERKVEDQYEHHDQLSATGVAETDKSGRETVRRPATETQPTV